MTPWRRVFLRFNFPSQSKFALAIGCDKSKISRALRDPKGLINGADQEAIIKAAQAHKVALSAADLVPKP